MTTEEVFSAIAKHMAKGLMIHSQLSDYYGFLGLEGYQECHCYHYFSESISYKKLGKYYIKHYNRIIKEESLEIPHMIPADWYDFTRQQVNIEVRESAVQSAMKKWVNWEQSTKTLYEECYINLKENGDVAAALFIKNFIKDVDEELAEAEQELLSLSIVDYDFTFIMEQQKEKRKDFLEKMEDMVIC